MRITPVQLACNSLLAVCLLVAAAPAQNQPLRVFCSDGMKTVVEALAPEMERAIGRPIVPRFDSSRQLEQSIKAGEPFDVAVLTANVMAEAVQAGKVRSDTQTGLARMKIGVGIRAGATPPDISTPEAIKKTLLAVNSITFNPSGASAAFIDKMLARLGIAEQVKPKAILEPEPGRAQKDVAEGKAELVITAVPEIPDYAGLQLVGPLPDEFHGASDLVAGVATASPSASAAQAMIRFLASPQALATIRAKHLEPLGNRLAGRRDHCSRGKQEEPKAASRYLITPRSELSMKRISVATSSSGLPALSFSSACEVLSLEASKMRKAWRKF